MTGEFQKQEWDKGFYIRLIWKLSRELYFRETSHIAKFRENKILAKWQNYSVVY